MLILTVGPSIIYQVQSQHIAVTLYTDNNSSHETSGVVVYLIEIIPQPTISRLSQYENHAKN